MWCVGREEVGVVNKEILEILSRDYFYSVEGECNGCQLCEFLAVNNFGRAKESEGFAVVRQPVTWEEKEQCQEAMERCPLHGIARAPMIPECES